MPHTPIPFLMTLDVHSRKRKFKDLRQRIADSVRVLTNAQIPTTFFVPADLIEECGADLLRHIVAEGHQVACHGLLHRPPENFATDPLETQISTLRQAKLLLEEATGTEITTFRAPAFIMSATTLCALEEVGYTADASVNSQRWGVLSSQVSNIGWLTAPRTPYHPSYTDPYRRGTMRLWEVPMTAFVLPYTSLVYQALGVRFMRTFARCLHGEAKYLRKKPVVYMAHPEEFSSSNFVRRRPKMRAKLLLPMPTQGIRARRLLLERDEHRIYEMTMEMFTFLMQQRDTFQFLTVDGYLRTLAEPAQSMQLV